MPEMSYEDTVKLVKEYADMLSLPETKRGEYGVMPLAAKMVQSLPLIVAAWSEDRKLLKELADAAKEVIETRTPPEQPGGCYDLEHCGCDLAQMYRALAKLRERK